MENIKKTLFKIGNQIKDFLLKPKSREFFIFLFFYVLASGFWFLQTMNEDYETDFTIPIRLKELPDNIVMTNEPPTHLVTRVRDKGTVLLNYKLSRMFYPVYIDFSTFKTKKNNQVKLATSTLEDEVMAKFSVSSKLISIKPDTLEYIYSKGTAKRVPVRLKGKIEAGQQYLITDTIFSPDSVSIYAPTALLKDIDVAYTEEVDLVNIQDSTSLSLAFASKKGVTYVPNHVDVRLPVDMITEKTVQVPLRGIDFPNDKILRTFPSVVEVTFQLGTRAFNTITSDDFSIDISYHDLLKIDDDVYPIRITRMPTGIQRVRVWPNPIDFLIEKKIDIPND